MATTSSSRPTGPTLDQLEQLPRVYELTVPAEYMDPYQHMNVQYYFEIWNRAAGAYMRSIGSDWETMRERGYGNWVLRQVVDYLAEVVEGDTIAIRARTVDVGPKRMHNKFWMVNETRGVVAATSEVLVTCADLAARRTTEWPEDVAAGFQERLARFRALDWDTNVSGAIRV